ncbi:hypothetical protein ZOSMA_79G00610 [Zostera marina]|uniref:V-type proton ATPase subunit a n=1 Tax=Zostera marina TaxID=29655 RepID=A0A0K9NNN4_ZOSMR|nr:hypothetical protein ZOSMA_79G00610 [Zostera marina]
MKLFDHLPKMEFLRSEEMSFVQFIIPFESAHRAVTYLGDLGVVQFNNAGDFLGSSLKEAVENERKLEEVAFSMEDYREDASFLEQQMQSESSNQCCLS